MAMRADATPMFKSLIIKMTEGRSFSSTTLAVAAVGPVSTFMDPTGADADAGAGAAAGGSLPPWSQEGVSAMALL